MEIKNKKKNIKIILIIIITVAVVFLLVYIYNKNMAARVIEEQRIKELKEQEAYEEWLVENCECIERNYIKCPEGFSLSEGKTLCRNETKKLITNALQACSKYNCSREIHELNLETLKWKKIE